MKRILHITPDFNFSCGRSKLVYLYLKYFANKNEFETHFITNGGDSLGRLEEVPNLKFSKLNFATGLKNLYYISGFYNNIKSYVVKNKIDLIHTHHRFPEFIVNQIAHRINVKTIFSTHGFVKSFKSLSFKSDKIISVSNSITSYLICKYGISRERITTLYNPVETYPIVKNDQMLLLKKKYSIPTNDRVLLFMGRINYEKGYDVLIKAFEIISPRIKDVFLIFSGNNESKKYVPKLARINDRIKIIKPDNESQQIYSIADIVVLPSRSDSFPFVMIEAGTFKKPFIGGNTGGIAEFIENGKNGLLVDPGNHEQLAEKIFFLLKNKDFCKSIAENLYDKVTRLCDYNNYFREVEKIYNSLLSNK